MASNRTGAVLGGAALIASALALMNSQKVSASGQITLDDATRQLLAAIAQGVSDELAVLQSLPETLRTIPVGKGYALNTNSAQTGRIWINSVTQGYQMPAIIVPDDMNLLFKAWPTNAGLIYIGFSRVAVTTVLDQAYPLLRNESIGYRIHKADIIWIGGTALADSVTYTVEQN